MIEQLRAWSREVLKEEGFAVDAVSSAASPTDVSADVSARDTTGTTDIIDLTQLAWSSIDNVETRDVDQIEICERVEGGIRVRIAIADVDALVPRGSPDDARAAQNTVSVYGVGVLLPMLPEVLSEGLTSLLPDADRLALVAEFVVGQSGEPTHHAVYRAKVRNTAQLDYESVSSWLKGETGLPAAAAGLEDQLRMQHEAAQHLHAARERLGALEFERRETRVIASADVVEDIVEVKRGPARDLIEDFMIAANVVIAGFLEAHNVSWIRRMVGAPERWPKIVEIAAAAGVTLPSSPDRQALGAFLRNARAGTPESFADLSLSVLRLLGSGSYVVEHRSEDLETHFALGVDDYTHFTAPNRRYADVITQRIVKAVLSGAACPYSDAELEAIAAHCTEMEDKAHAVERKVAKRAGVLLLSERLGTETDAVVTSTDRGRISVTLTRPQVEARIVEGDVGLAAGDRVRVRITAVDVEKGHVNVARIA